MIFKNKRGEYEMLFFQYISHIYYKFMNLSIFFIIAQNYDFAQL